MALSLINDETSLFNFVVKEGNCEKGLVDTGIKEVPGLFIQPPEQRIIMQEEALSVESMTIDLSELDGPNHDLVVQAIVHASETLGFFHVVNHGVPLELLESLKVAAREFFNQPVEKKALYLKGVSPTPLVTYGSSFAPDNEKVLEWKDVVSMKYTNDADALEFWPNPCKQVALNYIKASRGMEKKILQVLIRNLGAKLDDSRFDELIGLRFVNINFYPVCPDPNLTVGVGGHSDVGMLTVLVQDGIGGLSAKKGENMLPGNEEWIEIPPIDGALVINVGDTLQILSNGRYKSGEHMIFYLGRNPITWQSQKQKTVALSSCEAEFMAATAAACQAIWLANLVKELTGQHTEPITLYVDNKSAISLMKNPVFHGRSKHINTRFHFIRERVEDKQIVVEHVNSNEQRADIFTKALAHVKFTEMRNMLGVTDTELGPV